MADAVRKSLGQYPVDQVSPEKTPRAENAVRAFCQTASLTFSLPALSSMSKLKKTQSKLYTKMEIASVTYILKRKRY
jgi:hypothetical protein